MKYLILVSSGDEEIVYDLDNIVNISFGLAQNLMNDSAMRKNGFKPLESVMIIYFKDNSSAAYSVAGLSMSFDR